MHGETTVSHAYSPLLRMGFTKPHRYRCAGALLPHLLSFSPADVETPHPEGIAGEFPFLQHFPSGFPARPLAGILSLEARTFLTRRKGARDRPARIASVLYHALARRRADGPEVMQESIEATRLRRSRWSSGTKADASASHRRAASDRRAASAPSSDRRPSTRRFSPAIGSDYVVAADAGFASLMRAGIHPDAVVGDFDSLGFVPDVPDAVVHPARKDEATCFLPANRRWRMDAGPSRCSARSEALKLDQTYATLQTLVRLSHRGIRSFAAGDGECVAVLTGGAFDELFLPASLSGGFSVFSASDRSFGVDEEGASYALSSATLSNDVPLGLSNECAGAPIRISVSEGDLLVFLPSSTTFDV